MRDGPEAFTASFADVAERAPVVARAVLAPARDRDVAPPAVATACVRDGDVIAAVGQQVHLGR